MATNPSRDVLAEIKALDGQPRVTYPNGDKDYPVTERIERVMRGKAPKDFLTAEPLPTRFPNNRLTEQSIISQDQTHLTLYAKYEILPGPWIPFTRYDDNLGPIQGRRRIVQNTGQVASLTATAKTTYEARGDSDLVSIELEETNSDGTGSAGNPAYPILVSHSYDEVRGDVRQTSQVVATNGTEEGSLIITGGGNSALRTTYEAINQFLSKKITEEWLIPGPAKVTAKYDAQSDTLITVTRTQKLLTDITEGVTNHTTYTETIESEASDGDNLLGIEVKEHIPTAGAHDFASAQEEEITEHLQFPATLDPVEWIAMFTILGYTKPFTRVVPQIKKTWWVIAATKPAFDPATELNGIIEPSLIPVGIGGLSGGPVDFGEVIIDAVTLNYPILGGTLDIPASSPTLTDYLANWVNGDPRGVRGTISQAGSKFRWKMELIQIVYRLPFLATP